MLYSNLSVKLPYCSFYIALYYFTETRWQKKKKPTSQISMRTLIRILNSSLLITYLQYLCFLCFTGNICSEFQLSSFSPQWRVISLSFHISGFRFRWPILGWLLMAPYAWANIWCHEIAMFREQREAESEISFQVQVLGMNLTTVFQKEKQEWGG